MLGSSYTGPQHKNCPLELNNGHLAEAGPTRVVNIVFRFEDWSNYLDLHALEPMIFWAFEIPGWQAAGHAILKIISGPGRSYANGKYGKYSRGATQFVQAARKAKEPYVTAITQVYRIDGCREIKGE
ncbi:hypothetical protein FQN57_006539 [Myotisia sp. PD_48]|nr:hypothetical protein FQN57_006539 [Myotisia sp. PD_48]